ncbi:acetyltransferase [Halomonas daqingensis]|uniref:Acetyltransferase n=1 Tax=Billgrantia desiderata TaxID=52021 RepID=A0AAW4YS80_9GAMM|nr:acetyltransferase [Halomonas desiderata]MCE8027173.1 acetyltransferase [Halomonas desiderata]MCE8050816.1 acetyltransferase [Halomonas desiderata]
MSNRRRLAILGASGHGKVVADIAIQSGWQDLTFYDDAWPRKTRHEHWEVRGTLPMLLHDLPGFDGVIVAIGHNGIREAKLGALLAHGARVVTLVHPRATISPLARLGPGCVVVAGAVVNAFAELGEGCIVNTCASVGHDCRLGACVHVAPGANVAGDVEIGRTSWIGAGAAVRQGMTIGEGVMVGAGAAVVASVGDRQVVGGVPARPLSPSSTDAGTADNPDADPLSDTSNVLRLNLPSPQGRS